MGAAEGLSPAVGAAPTCVTSMSLEEGGHGCRTRATHRKLEELDQVGERPNQLCYMRWVRPQLIPTPRKHD